MKSSLKSYRDAKVFVTGATGLVGGWLCRRLLDEGAQVTVLVRDHEPQSLLLRDGDVGRLTSMINGELAHLPTVQRALNASTPDIVFHLAAQSQVRSAYRSPLECFESNALGTATLLEAMRNLELNDTPLVVASSDKAYGSSDKLPYEETFEAKPVFPYDTSKYLSEVWARCYAETYGFTVVVSRCGNIFGGGDLNWDRLIPGTIRWVINDEPIIVRSDGQFTRDYIYVEDIVDAYLTLGLKAEDPRVKGEVFNISNGLPLKVLDVIDQIQTAMGTSVEPVIENSVRAEIPDQSLSATKAKEILGWSPKWSFEEGIAQTVDWYRRFLESRA